ncbi:50S ribosomal protein L13 [Patescibacteria group bacterium]|nr:50S ribosomal protein L13 [Patescibacteria group bacterium]
MEKIIDVKNKKLGRIASEIATILQNKKSAYYDPRLAGSGDVIIKNIDKLDISLKKKEQKIYYHHTGYIGHLKEKRLKEFYEESPKKVLRKAVEGMLPKNSLRKKRLKRLIIE